MLALGACLSVGTIFSQNQPNFPPLSSDSLVLLYEKLDEASMFELQKLQETLIYRIRVAPTDQNKEILNYVEQRLAIINKKD